MFSISRVWPDLGGYDSGRRALGMQAQRDEIRLARTEFQPAFRQKEIFLASVLPMATNVITIEENKAVAICL